MTCLCDDSDRGEHYYTASATYTIQRRRKLGGGASLPTTLIFGGGGKIYSGHPNFFIAGASPSLHVSAVKEAEANGNSRVNGNKMF